MTHDNILMALTPREVEVIRGALRLQEDNHKRNDFPTLVLEVQALRSKVADIIIEHAKDLTRV
jgi:hypothetical protein